MLTTNRAFSWGVGAFVFGRRIEMFQGKTKPKPSMPKGGKGSKGGKGC